LRADLAFLEALNLDSAIALSRSASDSGSESVGGGAIGIGMGESGGEESGGRRKLRVRRVGSGKVDNVLSQARKIMGPLGNCFLNTLNLNLHTIILKMTILLIF